MITNERQYRITKSQLDKLQAALQINHSDYITKNQVNDILATAELQALESEIAILKEQLHEYEELQSGSISLLEASSLAELPIMLIRARIAQKLSQKEFADLLELKEQQIQRYESQQYSGVSLHRLKEIADALKLTIKETAEISPIAGSKQAHASKELDWSKFPITEIYRRGWIEGFTGSIVEAKENADILIPEFISQAFKSPRQAFHHKLVRSGSVANEYSLFSWECRVINLATRVKLEPKYSVQLLDSVWFSGLCKASSKDNGPLIAKAMLQEVGIPLIIEPHLPNTYLDGAALLAAEYPIIGMTLRYDRLDNFWFVLFHELFHVINHLQTGKLDSVFDDDIESGSKEGIEKEADNLAEETMIPSERWITALPRYVRSEESVTDFANDLGVHRAIVAGRIRYETKNYTILNELVGQGLVRKQFPDINFGV